ncbi:hypothetical protein [Roseivirga seohaensis]|uniref:hypothetical protein n=1 Tax=Roseivirga seohaensis TaxID=1914963 RepID=UPI003BAD494D
MAIVSITLNLPSIGIPRTNDINESRAVIKMIIASDSPYCLFTCFLDDTSQKDRLNIKKHIIVATDILPIDFDEILSSINSVAIISILKMYSIRVTPQMIIIGSVSNKEVFLLEDFKVNVKRTKPENKKQTAVLNFIVGPNSTILKSIGV